MKSVQLAVLAVCLCAVSAGSWLPEKLVKKFAMKKIAEDCYGKEVMDGIKKEMYAAHVKCSGHHADELPAAEELVEVDDEVTLTRRRRQARHFGIDKLEKLRSKVTNYFGNATCMLRELKMLDAENNVDLDSMKERLANMEIEEALKTDLSTFMDECHELASCLPESVINKPGTMGFGRQMCFFSCFKEAKLEACMKKTFREDYLPMLVEKAVPADEEESFYTFLMAKIVKEDNMFA